MSQGRPAWIKVIPPAEAEGELADAYREIQSIGGGEPAHILQAQSLDPQTLKRHFALYRQVMFAPSPPSRAEREAIAVAVSVANACEY